ncbi:pentatricopeptide repeat-containing protein At2g30780, partial [Asparagus officinalis]|uniref:pentatricopeptide repeat-containing protein At2g30780 n=1 Tax=Asparagus officinalis TaxID=4686 RepID=UPI00098DFB14
TPDRIRDRIHLLTEKPTSLISDGDLDDIKARVSSIADEILTLEDVERVAGVLDARSVVDLLRRSPNGSASVELLSRLKAKPHFALEVFNWRRRQADAEIPLQAEEYSKAITLAGRTKDIDLAVGLFCDAARTLGFQSTCVYNSLISAYMYNGYTKKAISVFGDLERDPNCKPSIVTYNILLSVFGRSMLVNHMEAILKTIDQSDDLSPTLTTYNTVIAGYVTAWMWGRMESTFHRMETGTVKPDASTYLLMLRGYAHSGNIERMESTYELVKEMVNNHEICLIQAMICAYCKSSDPDRVRKIENLMKFIPDGEYRPWLNILLIRLYAQEGLLESMDKSILEAFKRNTIVTTTGTMRSIISSYFRCDAVDQLVGFIRNAEYAGWRLCRSLYHCKMVMYGQHNRLEEMHAVLDEMEAYKFNPTKKTFLIMFKAYWKIGRKSEAESILGIMWKHGFCTTEDSFVF